MIGAKQAGFGDEETFTAKKRTRRERFLSEMEAVGPWKLLIDLIDPYDPKDGRPIRWRPCSGSICCSSGTT